MKLLQQETAADEVRRNESHDFTFASHYGVCLYASYHIWDDMAGHRYSLAELPDSLHAGGWRY